VVRGEDVAICVAVAGDIAIEAATVPGNGLQEPIIRPWGHTVDCAVAEPTRPFSTQAWKGRMYESTRSRMEMFELTWCRSSCSPTRGVVPSNSLAT